MGRKAYGAYRKMSKATQARNIAESIRRHLRQGIVRTVDDYQVVDTELRALVKQLLQKVA